MMEEFKKGNIIEVPAADGLGNMFENEWGQGAAPL